MATHVKIAELKARLSHYVRLAQRGHEVTVMDRDTPVARLVPIEKSSAVLEVSPPRAGAPSPGDWTFPPPVEIGIDIVDVLMDERGER